MATKKYWTRERIIASFHDWFAIYGRPPTSSEWFIAKEKSDDGHSMWPNTSIVQKEFGSWRKGIHAAGLQPTNPKKKGQKHLRVSPGFWTREKTLETLREWVEEHGYIPAITDWRGKTPLYPDPSTITRIFGTWNKMIRAGGYVPRPTGLNQKAINKYLPLPRRGVTSK